MSREWKPGDVALVDSWRGEGKLAFRVSRGGFMGWCVLDGTDSRGLDDHEVTSARPVLVIDPEDREQVGRLADELYGIPALLQTDKVRDALRSLLAPPKPPEPLGLGAVIEDATGAEWVRVGLSDGFGGVWARVGATDNLMSGEARVAVLPYVGIHVVRVLAEGRVSR